VEILQNLEFDHGQLGAYNLNTPEKADELVQTNKIQYNSNFLASNTLFYQRLSTYYRKIYDARNEA